MDPEDGSNLTAIDPTPVTQDAPETQEPSTSTPVADGTAQEPQETSNDATPAGRVQDILNAFNNEKNAPSTPTPAKRAENGQFQAQEGQPPVGRSYEGLDENEVRIFKRMSNDAYNHLFPIYKEWKTQRDEVPKLREDLKKLQGTSYYDHEQAYQLAPEYHQMTAAATRLEQEGEFWQQQLANVEAGQPYQDLMFDSASGKYSLTAPADPSPQAKAYILNKLTQSHTLRGQITNELQQFQGTFRTQHQNYLQSLNSTRDKVLEGVDPATRKALEKAAETKLELWPMGMRQRPEVKIAAELMVINDGLLKLLMEKEGQLSGRNIVNRTAAAAGPANVSGAGPSGGNTVDSALAAFKAAGFRH
jgi:hypothetical protein